MHSSNTMVKNIVFDAIRQHLATAQSGIRSYHVDSSRSEDLDEALRKTRVAKCATANVGSSTLNRFLSLQEDVLEATALEGCSLGSEAMSLLDGMASALDSYLDASVSGQGVDESVAAMLTSVKTYRAFRKLPEIDDSQIVSDLFNGSQECTEASCRTSDDKNKENDEVVSAELLAVFREEADDHLKQMYTSISQLKTEPDSREHLQAIRRAAHTLKGAAGVVGLRTLSHLSHRMEDLLDELFTEKLRFTSDHLALLLESTDVLQDLSSNEAGISPSKIENLYSAFDHAVGKQINDGCERLEGSEMAPPSGISDLASHGTSREVSERAIGGSGRTTSPARSLRVPLKRLDELRSVISELIIGQASCEQGAGKLSQLVNSLQPVFDRLRAVCYRLETQYEAPALSASPGVDTKNTSQVRHAGSTIDEDHADFDDLELDRYSSFHLLSRSLAEATSDAGTLIHELRSLSGEFDAQLSAQRQLTRDTQARVLQIRMLPFTSIAPRLHRAVREVSDQQNKNVQLVIDDQGVELDKTVLEELVDPLLHLLRNAVDHGIEREEVRRSRGKLLQSTITVSVSQHGTQIVIQIMDDGRGLDIEKIRSRAVQDGYLDVEESHAVSPQEIYAHIFLPGFSTASQVSEVSGRGVGMDVVRTNIENLNGAVSVDSTQGNGTTFTIQLPTTLVVTRALLVASQNVTYAIPTQAIARIHKVNREQVEHRDGESVVRIDDALYPLVRLNDHMGLASTKTNTSGTLVVALFASGKHEVALSFDKIVATRDIVVKTLGEHLGKVKGLLGATVLGDGVVVPILDPATLTTPQPMTLPPRLREPRELDNDNTSIMIVDDSISVRRALGALVSRANWLPIMARDGLDAMEVINGLEKPPSAILLDVEMPRMNGYEFLSEVRKKPEFVHTPILMITSRTGDKHRQRAIDLGATDYVGKPFEDDSLLELIRRHLG